jgi:hypothetical protein
LLSLWCNVLFSPLLSRNMCQVIMQIINYNLLKPQTNQVTMQITKDDLLKPQREISDANQC